MSALKFSQIQDMLINLATRMNRVEVATKDNSAAIVDLLSRADALEKEVSDIEDKEKEKEAIKAGTWSAVPAGESDTPIDGKIYILANDAPVTPAQEGDDPEPEPEPEPVGGATYTLKIDEIPSYIPTKDSEEPGTYKFIFTPTDDFEFTPITDEWPSIIVKATQEENENALEYTLTYAITDNNEKNFILTLTKGTLVFGDPAAEPATETKPVSFEAIPETSIPREEVVEGKKKKKQH